MKDLLSTADLTPDDLTGLLALGRQVTADPQSTQRALAGELVVLYLTEASNRTRITYATAAGRLGATVVILGPAEFQQGWGASVDTIARLVSLYASVIVARTDHRSLQWLAAGAAIPVLNGLGPGDDPAQTLGDLLTLQAQLGSLAGRSLAYLGPTTATTLGLVESCVRSGIHVRMACPPGRGLGGDSLAALQLTAARSAGSIWATDHMTDAVDGADAVYVGRTEAPVPAGEASLTYEAIDELMHRAAPGAVLLHSPPSGHRLGVSRPLVRDPRARIREQAENRLRAAMALLLALHRHTLSGGSGLEGNHALVETVPPAVPTAPPAIDDRAGGPVVAVEMASTGG